MTEDMETWAKLFKERVPHLCQSLVEMKRLTGGAVQATYKVIFESPSGKHTKHCLRARGYVLSSPPPTYSHVFHDAIATSPPTTHFHCHYHGFSPPTRYSPDGAKDGGPFPLVFPSPLLTLPLLPSLPLARSLLTLPPSSFKPPKHLLPLHLFLSFLPCSPSLVLSTPPIPFLRRPWRRS